MTFTVLWHKIQNLSWHERVINQRITGAQQAVSLQREQLWVSRTSTDEIDNSRMISSSHGRETSKSIRP
tara:strand:+ start:741 stop:947 length:207 start_codon:yes stop_codon:yes gene_type:complete